MPHLAIDLSSATPGRTGIGTYTHEIGRRLLQDERASWTALFHSLRQPPPSWTELRLPHVRFIHRRLPGPLLLEAWRSLAWPTAERLASGPCDLFFAPAMFVPPARHAALATMVHDLHFLSPGVPKPRYGAGYLEYVVNTRLPKVRLLLANSYATQREVRATLGSEAPVSVIPLGVDDRFYTPETPPRPTDIPPGTRYFLHVGGNDPRKNLAGLVHAYARATSLAAALSDWPVLVLAGQTAAPAEWESVAEAAGIRDKIIRSSYVPLDQLPALYHHAVALVFPSVTEGFGLPVVEAMACGCPVIASSSVAVLEHLPPDSAMVAYYEDTERLAQAMLALACDADRATHLADAGRRAAQNFTWDKAARLTADALLDAAANPVR